MSDEDDFLLIFARVSFGIIAIVAICGYAAECYKKCKEQHRERDPNNPEGDPDYHKCIDSQV